MPSKQIKLMYLTKKVLPKLYKMKIYLSNFIVFKTRLYQPKAFWDIF